MKVEPRTPLGRLKAEEKLALAGILLTSALAWVLTSRSGQPRSLIGFVAMWLLMMTAMMLPSVAPVAILWLRSLTSQSRSTRMRSTLGFLSGYLAAWGSFGVLAFLPSIGLMRLEDTRTTLWVGAAVFLVAGLYQLTPLKAACLRQCRSPLALILKYSSYNQRFRNIKVGMHHGGYCLGCCWGLMAVLVSVGAMNPVVMAIIATGVVLEKVAKRGSLVSKIFGIALLGLGVAVGISADAAMWLLPMTKMSM